jgi:hypothetical protein
MDALGEIDPKSPSPGKAVAGFGKAIVSHQQGSAVAYINLKSKSAQEIVVIHNNYMAAGAKLPKVSAEARQREARRGQLTGRKERIASDDKNSKGNMRNVRQFVNKAMTFYRKYN